MNWIQMEKVRALQLIETLIGDVQEVEISGGRHLDIRLRPAHATQSRQEGRLISLPEHCARLSNLLGSPEVSARQSNRQIQDEILDWVSAVEWLHIASSVDGVEVDTSRFDESVMWCRPAWEFQSHRSDLLSRLATQLTVFSFVWGSFETIVKLVDPPKVPRNIKPGSSLVDNAIFYLKNEYEPTLLLAFYKSVLADLREAIEAIPYYSALSGDFRIEPSMGISGVGLHVVRKIRNKFAHGTMRMPIPEDWSTHPPLDVQVIGLSTRIVLLTIQMLLLAYFKDEYFTVDCLVDEWGISRDEAIDQVLRKLHVRQLAVDERQLTLF